MEVLSTIDTCETQIDSILAVYTGNALGSLTKVADNNNHDGGCGGAWPYGSKVTFPAVAGETYRLVVGDAGGARSDIFTLNVVGPTNKAPTVTNVRPVSGSRIHDRTPKVKALVRFGYGSGEDQHQAVRRWGPEEDVLVRFRDRQTGVPEQTSFARKAHRRDPCERRGAVGRREDLELQDQALVHRIRPSSKGRLSYGR